jgi:hypothetical protein
MVEAKRARKAETLKQPSLCLRLRAPYFYPDKAGWKAEGGFIEWCGDSFSPDEFDPTKAIREMKKGFPDWRTM